MQCNNGDEFPSVFALSITEAGITYRYIRPRPPQQNGKLERSHRIDAVEFWSRQRLLTFQHAVAALDQWEHDYNYERFSLALKGRTPAPRLADSLPRRLMDKTFFNFTR